ncbi:transposable element Tcb1 transposase [Trichonephila clavipes]|nr:transposable element Tcb1 transposase [Trichonephila clavipes]
MMPGRKLERSQSKWKISSRVGRNHTTVMWICDRWMQEGKTDRRGQLHPPQCTTSREDRQIRCMAQNHRRLRRQCCDERSMWAAEWNEIVFTDDSRICLQHHDGRIEVWRHLKERMLNNCVMHHHTGPAPGIMIWGGIGYPSYTPLVRIAGTLFSQR